MSKKRDFSLVVWAFGWLLNLATLVKKYVEKLDVPFAAFEWLVSNKGESTLEQALKLIKSEYRASMDKLLGHVIYGLSVEETAEVYGHGTYCLKSEGAFTDSVKKLPKNGVYSLEFEVREIEMSRVILDDIDQHFAKHNEKRHATLSEAMQFMAVGQNGRKVTNWEKVYALGTTFVPVDTTMPSRYCFVHNNTDGMHYGCTDRQLFEPYTEDEQVRREKVLYVKSSEFIR